MKMDEYIKCFREYPWLKYFKFNAVTNKTKCTLCPLDKKPFTGFVLYTVKRHARRFHEEFADREKIFIEARNFRKRSSGADGHSGPKPKKLKLTSGEFIRNSVQQVALNNLPFLHYDKSETKTENAIHVQETKTEMSGYIVEEYTKLTATEIKNIIKSEVDGKLVSVKIDVATKNWRSFFGLNIQFFDEKLHKSVIRTLGVIELRKRHTAVNLYGQLKRILDEYNIPITSVISFTSDNGANVIACGKRVQEEQLIQQTLQALRDMEFVSDSDEDDDFFDTNEESLDANGLPLNLEIDRHSPDLILSISRCTAHLLNLAVVDTKEKLNSEEKSYFRKIRSVVKALRSSVYMEQIQKLKIRLPPIDVATRWMSSYLMIQKIYDIKEKLIHLYEYFEGDDHRNIFISNALWDFVENYKNVFKAAYDLSIDLQKSDLAPGTFLVKWKQCLLKLGALGNTNNLSKMLKSEMDRRLKLLFDQNTTFSAAIYIDPRFNWRNKLFLNSHEKAKEAQDYIFALYKSLKVSRGFNKDQNQCSAELDNALDELIENELDDDDASTFYSSSANSSDDLTAFQVIKDFNEQMRMMASDTTFIIHDYLKKVITNNSLLLEVCSAIATIPCTSVSVERNFSALGLLLSPTRNRLSTNSVNNLLIIKLNRDLLAYVNFDNMTVSNDSIV